MEDVASFVFLNFKGKMDSEGPLDAEARRQFDEVRRLAEEQQHWSVYWAQSVGHVHEAVLVIVQQICLLCEAEENYDEVDMFQRDILRLQELLRLLEQYLSMPSRRLSLVLGRDTHLLTLPKGQALTINLADLSLTTGLRLKRSTSSFEEQEGPLSDYPFAQLARPGGRPRRSTRHHLNDRTELTRWFTGQTVECFLKGPKKGETQQHVCIAEWASLEAMEVFQNPSRSSVQSWVPDGVMKYWESWTLDLQGPLIDGGAYERIKREAEALDKGQRGLKGCCIL